MSTKRTFLSKDIFKNVDSENICQNPKSLNPNISKNNIHTKLLKNNNIGIYFITEIIKSQNELLLIEISKRRKINLDELKREFLKVTYYTPTILRRESSVNERCKYTLNNIKKKITY